MRRGVTLLELLVVLVLMAMTSAVVVPAFRSTNADALLLGDVDTAGTGSGQSGLMPTSDVDRVLTQARRLAIRRGEPVRVRVADDGVWAIVSANGGEPLESGRVRSALSWQPDVTVDALGTCMLQPHVAILPNATAWDALACRWRSGTS